MNAPPNVTPASPPEPALDGPTLMGVYWEASKKIKDAAEGDRIGFEAVATFVAARCTALDAERNALRGALETATVRIGILRARMYGCNEIAKEEGRKPTHELMAEADAFHHEAQEALASSAVPPTETTEQENG